MKRICGIGFYWRQSKYLKLKIDAPSIEWKMGLYGFSVGDVFIGVMVRGKRS